MTLVTCLAKKLISVPRLDAISFADWGIRSLHRLNWRNHGAPLLLWLLSLGLILSTTTSSPFLEGTDIHLEYYFASQAMSGWDSSIPHAYNSSITLGIIAPFLGRLVGLENVFHWVFPVVYSFVPVILYAIFRRLTTQPGAFWGVIIFIVIPTFFIEITGIAKQQVGSVFFLLSILALLDRRYILLIPLGTLTAMTHYSLGFLLAFFLIAYTIGIPILSRWFHKPYFGTWWPLAVSVAAVILLSGLYLGDVAQGVALSSASYVGNSYIGDPTSFAGQLTWKDYLDVTQRDPVVQTALGLDFLKVPIEGQIFRIVQFVIQALVVIGVILCIRRRLYAPMVALVGIACALLLACVFVPSFASILNPSRFYLVAFFFLPLAFVGGAAWLFRRHWQTAVAVIASVYFLFTSGVIFEALKLQPDQINIPYSIAASHARLDIGTKYTQSDRDVAEWLSNQADLPPVMADIYGLVIIQEQLGINPLYLYNAKGEFAPDSYLFLRDYNTETQTITLWLGAGLRMPLSLEDAGLLDEIQNRPILFRSGGSVVLGIGEG